MRGFTNMLMYVTNALLAAGLDMSSCTGQQATAAASSATESSGGLFAGLGSLGSMLIPLLLIVVLIIFTVAYMIIWFVEFLIWRHTVKKMNEAYKAFKLSCPETISRQAT